MDKIIERLEHLSQPIVCGLGVEDKALLREAAAALRAVRDDTRRLDSLADLVNEYGGVRLHNDFFDSRQHLGLGLACTNRTLRQALDALVPVPHDSEVVR